MQSQTLTVQMVSNPSWYAVMALPYLMEFPYECTRADVQPPLRQLPGAAHRRCRDPKIRRVFDQWKGTPALDSPLEKNQDLKAVMLEETPWVRQAQAESQARRNVGILFDENRLQRRDGPAVAEARRDAAGRRGLAVVPRRPAERLHHALHHHRLRPAAAPGGEDRHRRRR